MWTQAVSSIPPPSDIDFEIMNLVLQGTINPVDLVNGALNYLDLIFILKAVKYKKAVESAYSDLIEHKRQIEKLKHGGNK